MLNKNHGGNPGLHVLSADCSSVIPELRTGAKTRARVITIGSTATVCGSAVGRSDAHVGRKGREETEEKGQRATTTRVAGFCTAGPASKLGSPHLIYHPTAASSHKGEGSRHIFPRSLFVCSFSSPFRIPPPHVRESLRSNTCTPCEHKNASTVIIRRATQRQRKAGQVVPGRESQSLVNDGPTRGNRPPRQTTLFRIFLSCPRFCTFPCVFYTYTIPLRSFQSVVDHHHL